jgi:hypothetical protein
MYSTMTTLQLTILSINLAMLEDLLGSESLLEIRVEDLSQSFDALCVRCSRHGGCAVL